METRISSMLTPFFRFVLIPIFAFAGVGMLVTALVAMARGDQNGSFMIVPCLGWFTVMYFIVGRAWRAQTVMMTATGLRVANRSEEVPFGEIEGVTENVFSSPELVTVHTRRGDKIRFLATYRVRWWFTNHPIVETLRHKAIAAVRVPGSEIDPELGLAPARVVRRRA